MVCTICGWDGEHPGLTIWNLPNYTRIESAHKVHKKLSVSLCGCYVYVQLLGGQNRFGLVWAVMINLHELPIYDGARNDPHIASTRVRLYSHTPRVATQKQNGKQVMHQKRQLNQTGWKRTVLNFGSIHQLNVHNYLSIIFYFNLIARYGKNYVTITLTGFASHT